MAKKPAKTAPAPAPAPESESSAAVVGVRGPKGVELTATITLLTAANPKREGSKSFARFASYVDGMTVQAALDAGILTADLVYDAGHSFIAISGYTPPKVFEKKERPVKEAKAPKAKKVKAEKSADAVAAENDLAAATAEEIID